MTDPAPNPSTGTANGGSDPIAIVEDDQQLYDWGIENRLDQYYAEEGAQHHHHHSQQHPFPPPLHTHHETGYVPNNPDIQPQNLTTYNTTPPAAEYHPTAPPPAHQSSMRLSPSQSHPPPGSYHAYKSTPPAPLPPSPADSLPPARGCGGRRPVLPQVDMDANEVLKVNNAALIQRQVIILLTVFLARKLYGFVPL